MTKGENIFKEPPDEGHGCKQTAGGADWMEDRGKRTVESRLSLTYYYYLKSVRRKSLGLRVRWSDFAVWKMPPGDLVPPHLGTQQSHSSCTHTESVGLPERVGPEFCLVASGFCRSWGGSKRSSWIFLK